LIGPIAEAIRSTVTRSDPSSANHVSATVNDLQILASHPLGVGLGQGGRIGRQLGQGLAGGENLFLVLGNQLGWLGLAAVIALTGALVVRLTRRLSREKASDQAETDEDFTRALLACLAIYVLASLTTEHAIAFQSAWLFWLSLGWLLSTAPSTQPPSSSQTARPAPTASGTFHDRLNRSEDRGPAFDRDARQC
jgi:hypothetical protein